MSTIELSDSESPAAAARGPEDGRAADGPVTRLRVGTPRSESPAGYHLNLNLKLTDQCIVRAFFSGRRRAAGPHLSARGRPGVGLAFQLELQVYEWHWQGPLRVRDARRTAP
jgi:hypothetical protein